MSLNATAWLVYGVLWLRGGQVWAVAGVICSKEIILHPHYRQKANGKASHRQANDKANNKAFSRGKVR